ncbi:hypothetical protein L596_024291 [Steinernema carpocapsae]|uniref:39S ribosomal protein L30, mitochondrial n=1 Tax=Steinernema carpocapsae TaxID=34508 RepID=A0A4U5MGA1_STECR|nr:hypothetical protein L596_024291 [Steinernema carpocapsae]
MAKVIRNCWVYKPYGRWHRYLPRRHDGISEYEFKIERATAEEFPEKMDGEPPKLWLAWVYREMTGEPHWTRKRVTDLFGEDWKPGKMAIFKNTPAFNDKLWHVKHLIEVRPLTFPNGEPTENDVNSLEVFPDGRCVVDPTIAVKEDQLKLLDESKQMKQNYLVSRNMSKYARFKDIFEDNVYTPSNVSVME